MTKPTRIACLFTATVVMSMTSVSGSSALAQATALPPGAGLARVDEGVFELRQGASVDLTKHAILLTVKADQAERTIERGQFSILIAGQQQIVAAGRRIDLKRTRGIDKELKSKAHCFLDVVSFVAPKGAPATATFRLNCV